MGWERSGIITLHTTGEQYTIILTTVWLQERQKDKKSQSQRGSEKVMRARRQRWSETETEKRRSGVDRLT